MINHCNDRIVSCVNKLICSPFQYWGEFSLFINFQKSEQVPTCGVTIKNCSPLYYFNEKFVETLSDKELMFVHIHELFHLLCDHIHRTGSKEHKLSNIAQDMIINTSILEHLPSSMVEKLKFGYYVPRSYKGDHIYELLYDWMHKQREIYQKNKRKEEKKNKENGGDKKDPKGQPQPSKGGKKDPNGSDKSDEKGEPQGQDQSDEGQEMGKYGVTKEMEKIFDNLDEYEFDVHFPDSMDSELRKQIIDDIKNNLKNRGLVTGEIEKLLEKIEKSKKDYLKEIIRSISNIKGYFKKRSFKRPNRKQIFGLKGKVKYGSALNVMLDTSGSMCGYFEKILSVIFKDNIDITLIQCDTEVKATEKINNKRQIQKMKINGLGGTTLQPGIDMIAEKYNKVNTVILTDGATDTLNTTRLKKCLIISCGVAPKVIGNSKVILIDGDIK